MARKSGPTALGHTWRQWSLVQSSSGARTAAKCADDVTALGSVDSGVKAMAASPVAMSPIAVTSKARSKEIFMASIWQNHAFGPAHD